MAKHPSIQGHSKLSKRIAKLIPYIEYNEDQFFNSDEAPHEVVQQRRDGFQNLARYFRNKSPTSIENTILLENDISDVLFTNTYRVPFPYRKYVNLHLKIATLVTSSSGVKLTDMDGNESYDLTGSYGVNVFGYDFYKACIDEGAALVRDLGPVLGSYHPVIIENVKKLKSISGMDEVSFHMSGTEAVMQAVRLARYHTGRSHLVRFCGSYHGWWDGVQPGIGNPRDVNDVYTLKDMDRDTLKVLRTRKDIACILINPLQALHPNSNAPGDSSLINSSRKAHYDRESYTRWLHDLRKVCDERSIVMIMDEVFVGFRLAYGGAQEFFNVKADLVTYGKTLGGGLPIGVVCGKRHLMKRFRNDRPADISFARGTFNSHPYVMGAMHAFLRRIEATDIQVCYKTADQLWNSRVEELNQWLNAEQLPVTIVNLHSIWTITYNLPSRYNWMFQYYLRAKGLSVSWVGSGRIIMPVNLTDDDYEAVMERFVDAARCMRDDGWWWQGDELTDTWIKKRFFRELLQKRLSAFLAA